MAQITARFKVVSRTPRAGKRNGQTEIVLRGKRTEETGGAAENVSLFRNEQAQKQDIRLNFDTAQEDSVFVIGKDVLVTFNGPA